MLDGEEGAALKLHVYFLKDSFSLVVCERGHERNMRRGIRTKTRTFSTSLAAKIT